MSGPFGIIHGSGRAAKHGVYNILNANWRLKRERPVNEANTMEHLAQTTCRFFPQKARRAQGRRLHVQGEPREGGYMYKESPGKEATCTRRAQGRRLQVQGEPREGGYMYMALLSVCKQTQTSSQLRLNIGARSLILKLPWQKVDKGSVSLVCVCDSICLCMHALYFGIVY